MEESIIRKLKDILAGPIDSECKVVYVLAECRKLLEKTPCPDSFALKLYCHWALHVDLDNPRTTLPFLEKADEYARSVLAGSRDITGENRALHEFVFDTFRDQLRAFLKKYDLPTALCDEKQRWHEFLTYYSKVVEDGSISCSAPTKKMGVISEVVFTRGREVPGYYLPFGLIWTISLQDGRTLEVEVKASSSLGDEMILFGTKLPSKDRN